MKSTASIIQSVLSKPITNLTMKNKKLPGIEILRLYRQVLKYSARFYWNNERGQPWKDILRKSARKEFDLSKQEKDPFLVMKMVLTTRECMKEMDNKIIMTQDKLVKTVDSSRNEPVPRSAKSTVYR